MQNFEMVAKTLMGLEEVLAEELRNLGAVNVQPGKRMVSFEGDKEMLYKANLCCRTALRILKPFYKFEAHTPDELYERVKEYDWATILDVEKTFCIDTVSYSEEFTHSHFVTYRVKDAIADWFRDHCDDKRPGVRLEDADVMINVHINGSDVTLSLDSSGESLHKRGYREASTEAPINEVLAAGIILMSGWRGESPFVDPMCGSGTFLVEAAMIAANISPGIYRKSFAFEMWPDFDRELFDRLYNDDSHEREPEFPILGADISPKAVDIAMRNVKSAGVSKFVKIERKGIAQWEDAPEPAGVLITNPPYGERIGVEDMDGLYSMLGNRLKNVFLGYHAWIIGYHDEYFAKIGLTPSQKIPLLNGNLECELREYVIFKGDKKAFLKSGGVLKEKKEKEERTDDRVKASRYFDDELMEEVRAFRLRQKEKKEREKREKEERERKEREEREERKLRQRAEREKEESNSRGRDSRGRSKDDGERKSGWKERRDDRKDRLSAGRRFNDGERKERRYDSDDRRFSDGERKERRYGSDDRRFSDGERKERRYGSDDRRFKDGERKERRYGSDDRRFNDGERKEHRYGTDDRRFSDGERKERRYGSDDRRFSDGERKERKYGSDDRRFSDGERKERKYGTDDRRFSDGERKERKYGSDDKRGGKKYDDRNNFARESESENPLLRRRNPHALKSIRLKLPSITKRGTKK